VTRMDDRTRDFLKVHKASKGYVMPMNGKVPHYAMMEKQKRPTTKWKKSPDSFQNRPATEEEAKEWAAAEGVGIAGITGERSVLVALDVDCPEHFMPLLAELSTFKGLKTPTATSPGGGYHQLFQYAPGLKNMKVACPLFNDKDSPCYIGEGELASLRVKRQLIILPPGPGREWLPDYSPDEVQPAEVPDGLIDILEQISERNKNHSNRAVIPIENHCPIEQSVGSKRRTALLEDDSFVLSLVSDKDSPLIPALVKKLGGKGLRVPCPYHPPDNDPSANFRYHDKGRSRGWYFEDQHCSPGDLSYSIPVSQLCMDLETRYFERCASGGPTYQHRVYTLRKMKPEAFFWAALAAADLGLVQLPASRFPAKLEGFTFEGERLMRFIDNWDRARRGAGCNDPIPLGRPWLIKVLCALPNPEMDKDKPKSAEWLAAYKEHDNAITRAVRQGLLEKVARGVGNKAALYRVVPPQERQAKQDGGEDSGED
jgi:hypothetical protein